MGGPAARRMGRRPSASAESQRMSQAATTDVERLERVLLRRGVGVLTADRNCCADCGRTPLVGERVHLYEEHGSTIVCELCQPLRRAHPVASEVVRHSPYGNCVRLTARAA
jgi:hypothetical protein